MYMPRNGIVGKVQTLLNFQRKTQAEYSLTSLAVRYFQSNEIKTKISKSDLIKLKRFCTAKETINKTKRQTALRMGENNANEVTNQGLMSKIYKQIMKHSIKRKQSNKKWVEGLNRHFSKDIQMANKYMKRCSTSLIIREIQIKITIRYHLTLVRMAIIRKKSINKKCWKECGEKGNNLHC